MDDNVISGGHFEFYIFGGNHWSNVVVPAIFEISTLKNPLRQIFMLLSRCAHLGHISAPLSLVLATALSVLLSKYCFPFAIAYFLIICLLTYNNRPHNVCFASKLKPSYRPRCYQLTYRVAQKIGTIFVRLNFTKY